MYINKIQSINCLFNNLKPTIYKQNLINIFTINICSIKKHFNELCIIFDTIETKFKEVLRKYKHQ